jgi:membrane protease YdiL (CAAX protease family)
VSPSHNPELDPLLIEAPSALPAAAPLRDPVWSGWDVLKIAIFMFISPLVIDILLAFVARQFAFSGLSWQQAAQKPVVELSAEVLSYAVVLFFMIALIEGQYHRRFIEAIHWNWPTKLWGLAASGAALLIGLQVLAHFLPIPKDVPFEEFFKHPLEAYLTSILAISVGPLMEELFFRGFLYPVLARSLGVAFSVFLTAFAFGMLHAMQLGFAWGAVFIIFLVGLALTIVRAVTNSVACSLIVHISYNFTLTVLTFIGTDGFRHLERLNT